MAEGGGGGDGGDKSGTGLLATSASTSGIGSSLPGSPLPPHPLPPPGPTAGGEKKSASPRLAPWSGPEGI